MAWPGTLTESEQTSFLEWHKQLRAVCGEIARLMNHVEALKVEYQGTQNNTDGNMSRLAADDLIPNISGLPGAEIVTKTETLTIAGVLVDLLGSNTAAHRAAYARMCGEIGLIG